MSSTIEILFLASFFGGAVSLESCKIYGSYKQCDERCCTGSPNYCCESDELSNDAIIGIVMGCFFGFILLIFVFVCCAKKREKKKVRTSVANTTRALPTYHPPGAYTSRPFPVGGQGQTYPVQQYPGQFQTYRGQGQGQPYVDQGQQYPGQAAPLGSTQHRNTTQPGVRMSDKPYNTVFGFRAPAPQTVPSAPAYGFTQDVQPQAPPNAQPWSSGYNNQGFNGSDFASSSTGAGPNRQNYMNDGIPERTHLQPSAP